MNATRWSAICRNVVTVPANPPVTKGRSPVLRGPSEAKEKVYLKHSGAEKESGAVIPNQIAPK